MTSSKIQRLTLIKNNKQSNSTHFGGDKLGMPSYLNKLNETKGFLDIFGKVHNGLLWVFFPHK